MDLAENSGRVFGIGLNMAIITNSCHSWRKTKFVDLDCYMKMKNYVKSSFCSL